MVADPLDRTVRVEQDALVVRPGEVEQVVESTGPLVEGGVADPPGVPIVLDELEDRGLLGLVVVDEVRLGVRQITSNGRRGPGPQRSW